MNSVLLLIDSLDLWAPYYQTDSVITAIEYLQNDELSKNSYLVINLCSDLSYHSEGYYCSLLAQARKHRVMPSIDTLNKMDNANPIKLDKALTRLCTCHDNNGNRQDSEGLELDLFFGKCADSRLERLAHFIFSQYPSPLLRITFNNELQTQITRIRPLSLGELSDRQQDLFADSLDSFNRKVWRQPRSKKPMRYDLAIYYDPTEPFPPSNRSALNLFVSEAKRMNINAELITERDSGRLMEFDALFIRQTTAVNNVTYQLAQAAWQADMAVIDDPASIIRCTNKVYLKELLDKTGIAAPKSVLLFKKEPKAYQEMSVYLGEKMVIKIPDGSFSVGVSLVSTEQEYNALIELLFQHSSILLVQEFLPTEYDWRIGVLNGECIYACKYFMARGHWQIYHHKSTGCTKSGGVETLPVHTVPKQVCRIAKKACSAIGKGFYGVDIKTVGEGILVIEVNDNPSIDHGIEDKILGNELYRIVLREFVSRLDAKQRY